jgi:hypothetical protein
VTRNIGRYNVLMHSCVINALGIVLTILVGTFKMAWSQDLDYSDQDFTTTERLPRFQVEIIAFSYNEFDPSEENFSQKNNPRLIKLESIRPIAVVEEASNISEHIVSMLSTLQTHPDLMLDPIDPLFYDDVIDPFDEHSPQNLSPEYLIAVEENFGLLDSLELTTEKKEPAKTPPQTRVLDQDALELSSAVARLNRLNAYTVLAHGGWIQEGLSEEEATPIEIWILDSLNPMGTIKLHLSRFLHLTIALDFYAEEALPRKTADSLENITLIPAHEIRATRRARSGELHYFDHPAFGLLVSVKPAPPEPNLPEEIEDSINPLLGPATSLPSN